ncbi:hypothetical protein, partial [Rhizobium sp. SEMIA 4085]|uniref:hypothetical protein n=1 Tax=Rhizobium sp. SEMIA 4085 TaxID=2137761 RepID=UPI001AEEA6F6
MVLKQAVGVPEDYTQRPLEGPPTIAGPESSTDAEGEEAPARMRPPDTLNRARYSPKEKAAGGRHPWRLTRSGTRNATF